MSLMMGFSEEDVIKLKEFRALLNEKARFRSMSISESAQLVHYLQFYNQLIAKVEANILEVKKVHVPKEPEVKSKSKKS